MAIAIIGAGPAGLITIKSALEAGLSPTVFEKSNEIGGLWNPTSGSTWDSMRTNLSKYSCMFSDFPWNAQEADFPSGTKVYKYLSSYADAFNLRKYIKFSHNVLQLNRNKEDAKWTVTSSTNGFVHKKTFDFVVVCSGFFSKRCPQLNTSTFTGTVINSYDYRNPNPLKDKVVAVIGGSFSGTEIAVDVSRTASKVIHIRKNPFWILSRFLPTSSGEKSPLDLVFYRRKPPIDPPPSPEFINNRKHAWFSTLSSQSQVSNQLTVPESSYHLPPFVVISDGYLESIQSGKIEIRQSRADQVTSNGITLSDGTTEKVDAIIVCSGLMSALPFLTQEALETLEYEPNNQFQPFLLSQCTFHPRLPNIAFIGMYRGPYFAVMETQARWVTLAFSNPTYYPSQQEMEDGINQERAIRNQSPQPQFPHGDYVTLVDSMAKRIGVYPKNHINGSPEIPINRMVQKGPMIPSQFRLEGPFSNYLVASKTIRECNKKYP